MFNPPNSTMEVNASRPAENAVQQEWRVLQPIWDLRIGKEQWISSPLFPVFISIGTYFVCNIFFSVIDLWQIKIVQPYKMQSDKKVTWSQTRKAIQLTLHNQIVYILPTVIAQYIWTPPTVLPELSPTLFEFLFQVSAMLMLFDFQYWIWHACHHKNRWLYKNFHAVHHQYHSTFSWTTQYLHPWELFTVGYFGTVTPWFFNCHPLTTWCFMLLNVWIAIESHCGYDLPFLLHNWLPFYGGAPKHDMHHLRPLTNFQPYFRTWDRLIGWDCPGISAGNLKTKNLLAWEKQRAGQLINKLAFELMSGQENGELLPTNDELYEPSNNADNKKKFK